MRKGLIMFMLAALAGMASAADKPADVKAPTPPKFVPAPAPAAQEAAPSSPMPKARARKRLPRGDLRHCLGLKDNAAIIKCSEQRK
jgi:hypothetical protein